eukprot:TRINITY_DN13718_c0_g1_i1.p1 TRINITY_DN13718_c0_g1~~TRINITY_DN13718_c0_g1_i1.p1  ORF type:complete len:114 (-),score=6.24 TRINITY_DN13718_c0_g1_i1:279-620(-)
MSYSMSGSPLEGSSSSEQPKPQLTSLQSLALIQNLLRTSLASIAYNRKLFGSHNFVNTNMLGIQMRVFKPVDEDCKVFYKWIEKGVFDALEKNYLRKLSFGIFAVRFVCSSVC